ncbi:hypothetical protein EP331_00315 [bacterium]|nr:MAG: hypothetical protein EP331_00315 [bacterium]
MIDLGKLKQPMPYKWRVQSFSKRKAVATCVAYIDSRDVQNRLDEAVGPMNWQSDYKEVKGNLFAGIGIFNGEVWAWKWDCGIESNTEKEKGEASDSFKRAAVKWGIGRFLYDLDIQYVTANEVKTGSNYPYCVDVNGKQIYDLTKYINENLNKIQLEQPKKEKPKRVRLVKEHMPEKWNAIVKKISQGTDWAIVEEHFILTDTQKQQIAKEAEKL